MPLVSPIGDREKPLAAIDHPSPPTDADPRPPPVALAAGLLIGLAFDRFAPAQGATAAAAEAVEHAVESHAPRTWWRARTDPAVATGLALTAAVATDHRRRAS